MIRRVAPTEPGSAAGETTAGVLETQTSLPFAEEALCLMSSLNASCGWSAADAARAQNTRTAPRRIAFSTWLSWDLLLVCVRLVRPAGDDRAPVNLPERLRSSRRGGRKEIGGRHRR